MLRNSDVTNRSRELGSREPLQFGNRTFTAVEDSAPGISDKLSGRKEPIGDRTHWEMGKRPVGPHGVRGRTRKEKDDRDSPKEEPPDTMPIALIPTPQT